MFLLQNELVEVEENRKMQQAAIDAAEKQLQYFRKQIANIIKETEESEAKCQVCKCPLCLSYKCIFAAVLV